MGELVHVATRMWSGVAPVGRATSPAVAAIVGFAFGGVGLAIYFQQLVDLIVPLTLALVLLVMDPGSGLGWFVGALIAGLYGYFRSAESNLRRDGRQV